MKQKTQMMLKTQILITLLLMLLLLVLTGTATYAWFTFNGSTNILPISSTISDGDTSLLIANQVDGEFAPTTTLILANELELFRPVSTANLEQYYEATAQDGNGISCLYGAVGEQDRIMHGTVYLKAIYADSDVYLYREAMSISEEAQVLATMRLALKFNTREGSSTYIFKLDEFGDTSMATSRQTIPVAGTVVSSVDEKGVASFVADPAQQMGTFFANVSKSNASSVAPGTQSLCHVERDEVASVEYWLYMEGCDDNCINEVQAREIRLQLAFAGVKANREE